MKNKKRKFDIASFLELALMLAVYGFMLYIDHTRLLFIASLFVGGLLIGYKMGGGKV